MELRRTAEQLLRVSTPLTPYLIPYLSRATPRSSLRVQSQQSIISRSFSSSISRHDDPPQTGRFNLAQASSQSNRQSTPNQSTLASERLLSNRKLSDEIRGDLDFIRSKKRTNAGSISEAPFANIKSRLEQYDRRNQSMSGPQTNFSRIESLGGEISNSGLSPLVASPVALNASTGRSIAVDTQREVDLGRAFRLLEMRCAQNRIKQDFNYQRFHERPGLKRKRLRSQRWQRRFKESFNAIVTRVGELRKKGW